MIPKLAFPALAAAKAGAAAILIAFSVAQAPTVKASIGQRPGTVPGEITITVRLTTTDLALGSYQGTLRYTPGSLTIVSSSAPRGDGTRMANVADSAKGIIRFAGFTVSGFTTDDVLSLVVRAPRGLDAAGLSAVPEVAGDLKGVAVPKDHLVTSRGVTSDPVKD